MQAVSIDIYRGENDPMEKTTIKLILFRLLLWASCSAFLVLCAPAELNKLVINAALAPVLIYPFIKLPFSFDKLKQNFRVWWMLIGVMTSVFSGMYFYKSWIYREGVVYAANRLGIYGPYLVGALAYGCMAASIPFTVYAACWLAQSPFKDKIRTVRENKQVLLITLAAAAIAFAASSYVLKIVLHRDEYIAHMSMVWTLALLLTILLLDKCRKYKAWIFENRALLFAVAAAAFAASMPIFMYGFDYGHDGEFHMTRLASIIESLRDLQFPVRMNSFIYSDYGYPVSIFYGDLLLYIPAFLGLIGFSLDFAYKTYVLLINLATAAVSYLCFSKLFSKRISVLCMTAYVLASYRLVDIYVRMAVGEYTAMLFFPIIFLALWYIYQDGENDAKAVLLLAVGMSGLIYSHLLSTEMAVVVIAVVALVENKKTFTKKRILIYAKSVGLTLVFSASWWVPFVDYYLNCDTEIKATVGGAQQLGPFAAYISDYFAFFRSARGWHSINTAERLQLTPGLVLMGGLFLALWVVLVNREKNRRLNKLIVFSAIFIILSSTIFPWDWWAFTNPVGRFMSQIQFAWRYIGVVCIVLTVLLGYTLENAVSIRGKRDIIINAALVCSFLMCFYFASDIQSEADNVKITEASDDIGYTQYSPAGISTADLKREVSVSEGAGKIVNERGVNKDVYVEAASGSTVTFPVFCYPNYTVTDSSGAEYEISEGENRTIMVLMDNDYQGMLYLRYKEPWYWRLSELITLSGMLGTIAYRKKRNKIGLV